MAVRRRLSLTSTPLFITEAQLSSARVTPTQFKAGNPYGASFTSNNGALKPDETALAAARFQGKRVTELASQFIAGRLAPVMDH
jgi:multimeric flavodoxin WrbA